VVDWITGRNIRDPQGTGHTSGMYWEHRNLHQGYTGTQRHTSGIYCTGIPGHTKHQGTHLEHRIYTRDILENRGKHQGYTGTPGHTGWGDESWTAFCGPANAAVGGLWAERLAKSARRPSKRHFTYGGASGRPSTTMLYRWPPTHR
jgi:hypothetical protein